MNAIGYVRCSTQKQVDSGLGLDAQGERIRAYCALKQLVLVRLITDAGVSGGKPLASRKGGAALLDAIQRREAGAVVMFKLDRMLRNAGDCLTTVERWERSGVALHVMDLGGNAIDTTSAAGRFMLTVLAGAAEMERHLVRERTKAALAVKWANGQRVGTIPYGYDLAPDGVELVENATEQADIANMLAMRSCGRTRQHIADALTERVVPTKTRRSTRWGHTAVRRILTRRWTSSIVPTTQPPTGRPLAAPRMFRTAIARCRYLRD